MTDFEKAEKLREKTGVSYTDAKDALENTDGSLLEALVYLEKQGKVDTPPGGGFYSGANPNEKQDGSDEKKRESFSELMKRFGRFCMKVLDKGMTNCLEASKNGEHLFSIPVLAFILLLVIFIWVTLPVFIITLFCGIRYRFSGPDLDRDDVNNVMDSACNIVDDVKKSFTEEINKDDKNTEKENTKDDDEVCD
ncbi:MAG: ubiquitin [Oscillospiraceae bacterium]|nr:ubiquitin [Oscillospiraceae bacterium]